MRFSILNVAFLALAGFVLSDFAVAQPPGRGPGGRGPGGRGPDPSEFIGRMDTNGNGSLDPDEISDRARGFLIPRLKEAGIDTSKPIPIAKITEAFQKMREDREKEYNREREGTAAPKSSIGLVGDFSYDEETPLVPDFSLPDDSPLLQSGPLEERYSREVMERTNRTLREYDRNRNGYLDGDELKGGRWSPHPSESDLNNDGKLTKVELAERYKKKYGEEYERERREGERRESSRDSERSKEREREEDRNGRERSSSSSESKSSSSSSSESKNDKIQKYAKSMMDKYDKNKDGKLDESEYRSMRGKPERADSNKDKKVSLDELTVYFGGTPGKSTSRSSKSAPATKRIRGGNSKPSLEERLEEMGVSSKFISQDKNQDGNLQMSEFSSSWNEKKLEEFDELDSNRDGVISPSEWLKNGGR